MEILIVYILNAALFYLGRRWVSLDMPFKGSLNSSLTHDARGRIDSRTHCSVVNDSYNTAVVFRKAIEFSTAPAATCPARFDAAYVPFRDSTNAVGTGAEKSGSRGGYACFNVIWSRREAGARRGKEMREGEEGRKCR